MNQEIAAPGSYVVQIARKYIDELYAQIKPPRLLIFLDLTPQVAHQRKPDHSIDLIAGKKERLLSGTGLAGIVQQPIIDGSLPRLGKAAVCLLNVNHHRGISPQGF